MSTNIINNKSNSDIISAGKNPLALSESPVNPTKPPTYFSHIIQQTAEPAIMKKQTLFSFGEDEPKIVLKN